MGKRIKEKLAFAIVWVVLSMAADRVPAQNLTIDDFLSLRDSYNRGAALSSNSSPRRSGWELEKRLGDGDNILCELWRIGSTTAASKARLAAGKNSTGEWNLLYWIYDTRLAELFEKSLTDDNYTLFSINESSFEETKVYRRTDYDQCVKVKRLHNTARFNQPERQYIVTLGDSYCSTAENVYLCTADDHELEAGCQSHYTVSGGMITGLYAVTDSVGDTLLTANYREGQREGECRIYRKNGTLRETTHYKNDLLNGEQATYDEKGRKTSSTQWGMGWLSQKWPDGTSTRSFVYFNPLGRWKDSLLYHYDREGRCIEEEFYNIKYDGTPGHHSDRHLAAFRDSTGRDTMLVVNATYASLLPYTAYPDELAWAYYVDATLVADSLDDIAQAKLKGVSDSVMWGATRNGWTDTYSRDTMGRALERTVRSYIEGRIETLRQYAGHREPLPLVHSALFKGRSCTVRNRKGTTLAKGSVRGDRKHGKWQHLTDEKKPRVWKEEYYADGELDSLLTQKLQYDTTTHKWQRIYLTATYDKGTLHGPYELKDSEKLIMQKGDYQRGERHGDWTERTGGDTLWLRHYSNGAKDGTQKLTVGGRTIKTALYQHSLLRELATYDTTGRMSRQFLFDYQHGDIVCRQTTVVGDTTWVKTWRGERYESIGDIDYDNFEQLVDSYVWADMSHTDGERLVHQTGDTSRVYARGRLLRDQHIGQWEFVDYEQAVRLQVKYDDTRGDLLRRERYTDLFGNPYSGRYWYNGDYVNDPPIKEAGENREVSDGLRTHGLGSRTKQ